MTDLWKGFLLKPSLICWTTLIIWSSQLLPFLNPACAAWIQPFISARWYRRFAIIRSNTFTTHDVRLIGRYDAKSLAGFLALSRGMMVATSQFPGHSALLKDWLKILNSSVLPFSPSSLRKAGGMSSGPAAPFLRIAWMAWFSSCKEKFLHALIFGPVSIFLSSFFSFLFMSLSLFENLCLLTRA